jgi:hypothetical protein
MPARKCANLPIGGHHVVGNWTAYQIGSSKTLDFSLADRIIEFETHVPSALKSTAGPAVQAETASIENRID